MKKDFLWGRNCAALSCASILDAQKKEGIQNSYSPQWWWQMDFLQDISFLFHIAGTDPQWSRFYLVLQVQFLVVHVDDGES